jgi:hypothetical protein
MPLGMVGRLMVAGVKAFQAGLVSVADPPQGTLAEELAPLSVTVKVADPPDDPQVSLMVTPPEARAAAGAELAIVRALASSEISPSRYEIGTSSIESQAGPKTCLRKKRP